MFIALVGSLAALFMPEQGHAQCLSCIATAVSGGLSTVFGFGGWSGGPEGIAASLVGIMWGVTIPIATFFLVRAGLSLINSQEEDKLSKAKKTISATLIGIILVFISQRLVNAFFVTGVTNQLPGGGPLILMTELDGIMNWVTTMMGVLGVAMIIVAGLRTISSFGKEEGVTQMRSTVLGVAAGIILILITPVIKRTLGIADGVVAGFQSKPDVGAIIGEIAFITGNLLLFLAIVAVSVVIYAGVMMIITFGNEEQYGKSRSLIFRAMIGLVVILISYALAAFVLSLF